jgi:hypothetical protein
MYSPSDYSSDKSAHPPLIGWGLDGYEIYGRYLYDSNVGYSVALNSCGGHVHIDTAGVIMPYHYHSQVLAATVASGANSGQVYNSFIGGVYQCWRGNISVTAFFNQGGNNKADYMKPCCGTTQYYAASGITIPTTVSAPTATPPTSVSAPTSSGARDVVGHPGILGLSAVLLALYFLW